MYYFFIPIELYFDTTFMEHKANGRIPITLKDRVIYLRKDLAELCINKNAKGNHAYFEIESDESSFTKAYSSTINLLDKFLNAVSVLTSCGSLIATHQFSLFVIKDSSDGPIIYCQYVDPYIVTQSIWEEMQPEFEALMFSKRSTEDTKRSMTWLRVAHLLDVREIRFSALMMALESLAGFKKSNSNPDFVITKWENIKKPALQSGILTEMEFKRLKELRNAFSHGRPNANDYQDIHYYEEKIPKIFIQMIRRNKKLNINSYVDGVGRGRATQGTTQLYKPTTNITVPSLINDPLNYFKDIVKEPDVRSSSLLEWLHSGTTYNMSTF